MITPVKIFGQVSDGNVQDFELQILMSAAACLPPNASIFQFGTFEGRTSATLAQFARVWTLDLGENEVPDSVTPNNEKYFHHKLKYSHDGVTYLFGDSVKFDFTPYYRKMDMVFIDANHDFEYVKSDIINGTMMLREGSDSLWLHDYGYPDVWPGVTEAVKISGNSGYDWIHFEGTSLVKLAC